MPGGGPEQGPTRTYMPNHPAKAPQRTQQKDDDFCDHALTKATEAHQQALVAVHPLEEKIERLSQLVTRMQPTNCWYSYSHSHSSSWSQDARGGMPTPQVVEIIQRFQGKDEPNLPVLAQAV